MPTIEDAATEELLAGRYRLEGCIGEGGMSRVHCAEDVLLGRRVAVKLLRNDRDALTSPERARAEMAALAGLSSPSLVTLFDAHIAPGRQSYLVMEYIDGPTLAERIDAGPLEVSEVALLAADLAEALCTVHAAGVVHRDVKPSNVMLAPTGLPGRRHRAKLADFGIACLRGSERITSPGFVVGTAAYLAPEQLRGAVPAASVDVYALGLVLLEALTGRRAFAPAIGIEAVTARLTRSPDVPQDLPGPWRELLMRMIAEDPGARPSAAEVVTASGALRDVSAPDREEPDTAAFAPSAPERALLAPPTEPETPTLVQAVADAVPARGAARASRRSRRPYRGRRAAAIGAMFLAAVCIGAAAATSGLGGDDSPARIARSELVVDEPAVVEPADVGTDTSDTTSSTPADEPPAPVDSGPDEGAQPAAPRDTGPAENASERAHEAAQERGGPPDKAEK